MRRRRNAVSAGVLSAAAALTLLFASGGSAAGSGSSQIAVRAPAGGFTLPKPVTIKTAPTAKPVTNPVQSPSSHPLTLPFTGNLSCGAAQGGQVATCTALATIVAPHLVAPHLRPLTNVAVATFTRVFQSGSPIRLVFALSQHTVDLLTRYGDPRCTVVIAIVDGGARSAAGTNDGSSTVGKTMSTSINVK